MGITKMANVQSVLVVSVLSSDKEWLKVINVA